MKVTPLGALTAANFAMLAAIGISQIGSATADTPPQILRGGGIEIVDAQGRLRASLTLQNDAADTVLFRLIDPRRLQIARRERPHRRKLGAHRC